MNREAMPGDDEPDAGQALIEVVSHWAQNATLEWSVIFEHAALPIKRSVLPISERGATLVAHVNGGSRRPEEPPEISFRSPTSPNPEVEAPPCVRKVRSFGGVNGDGAGLLVLLVSFPLGLLAVYVLGPPLIWVFSKTLLPLSRWWLVYWGLL
jgi:hypothetical protein